MYKVFLDMDGVTTDFVGGACKAHGKPIPYDVPENKGLELEKIWRISPQEFWKPLDSFEFWFNLDKMPDADQIVDLLTHYVGQESICMLSAPSESQFCIPGKREWLRRNYPQFGKNVLFGSAKHFLAGEKRILVDDLDKNLIAFKNAGGVSILVPRIWNSAHGLSHRSVEFLNDQFTMLGFSNAVRSR